MEKLLKFGELGKLILQKDWSKTSLGPISSWPGILKTSVETILRGKFPMVLYWGKDLVQIPNDAFLEMLCTRASDLVDLPGTACKRFLESEKEHLLHFLEGEDTTRTIDKQFYVQNESDQLVEKYFTHSYRYSSTICHSYIPSLIFKDENVCGIMASSLETTEKVTGERQFHTLTRLYSEAVAALTVDDACHMTIKALSENRDDLSFALLYVLTAHGEELTLKASFGVPENNEIAANTISMNSPFADNDYENALRNVNQVDIQQVQVDSYKLPPVGLFNRNPKICLVVPLLNSGGKLIGALVAGVSPHRDLNRELLSISQVVGLTNWWCYRKCKGSRAAPESSFNIAKLEVAQKARSKAEDENACKDLFLACFSHELRTPLTPALLLAEDISCNPDVTVEIKEDAIVIKKNITIELQLIDDLLDVARICHKKIHLELKDVDIIVLLNSVIQMLQESLKDKKVELQVLQKADNTWISADATRLHQVFWNLLKNAIKFTPGGGKITITLTNPTPQNLQVEVKDTGIGMEPSTISKLFAAFQQGNISIPKQFGGLGMGLYISLEVARLHSGTLVASSEGIGKGSVFSVCLPTVKMPTVIPSIIKVVSPIHSTKSLRILLVEDNLCTTLILARILGKLGHTVKSASCVSEALGIQLQLIDLLLCDIGLPDGSGLDVVKVLKSRNPQLKAIALSGYATTEDHQASLQAGFDTHLAKPVQTETLVSAISDLFN